MSFQGTPPQPPSGHSPCLQDTAAASPSHLGSPKSPSVTPEVHPAPTSPGSLSCPSPHPLLPREGGGRLLEKDTTPALGFPGVCRRQRPLQPARSRAMPPPPAELPQRQRFPLRCWPALQGPWGSLGQWVIQNHPPCCLRGWRRRPGPAWRRCPPQTGTTFSLTPERLDPPMRPRPRPARPRQRLRTQTWRGLLAWDWFPLSQPCLRLSALPGRPRFVSRQTLGSLTKPRPSVTGSPQVLPILEERGWSERP